jgi:transcriptional regulator with XRE-family HTH domain
MDINSLIQNMPWNERMEVLRAVKKWSQDVAAEHCGTTKKNYWLWASGRSYPRRNSRRAIAMAFGIPESEIFGRG